MSGPWEQFQPPAQASAVGPWNNFKAPSQGPVEQARTDHPILSGVASLATGGLSDHITSEGVKQAADYLPLAGSMFGGAVGGLGGTAVAPGVGTVAGETAGAGAGGAAGSVAKDMVNKFVFGEQKSAGDIAKDAGIEGAVSGAGQLVGAGLLKGAGKVLGYAGEKVVPAAVIQRYKTTATAIRELIGSDSAEIQDAADTARKGMNESIDEFRANQNAQIAQGLKDSRATVNSDNIIKAIKNELSELHPVTQQDQRAPLEALLEQAEQMHGYPEAGKMTIQDANALKQKLQSEASLAYRDPGQVAGGTDYAKAAKNIAAVTRGEINKVAPDSIRVANQELASLHEIEDVMNKSLLTENKPAAGLIAAGAGKSSSGAANAKQLKILGNIVGKDFLGQAQDIAGAKAFGADSLYKRGAGALTGAALGAGAAELTGGDPTHGAIVGGTLGGALTSPFAVKTAIDVGRYIPAGLAAPAGQALGQSVMHGYGAKDALRKVGQ